MDIQKELINKAEEEFRLFQLKLLPTLSSEVILGVRTPELRHFAKQIANTDDARSFLKNLPHRYFDENNLHMALIEYGGYDFDDTLKLVSEFLPHLDNWATCDQFVPSVFKKEPEKTAECVEKWIKSDQPYIIRFALNCLMKNLEVLSIDRDWYSLINAVKSDHYYVKMGIAWFYSVALAEQWEVAYPILRDRVMDPWIRAKSIQKGCESFRISQKQKQLLRALKGFKNEDR